MLFVICPYACRRDKQLDAEGARYVGKEGMRLALIFLPYEGDGSN